jgi:hypothetical protein
MCRYVALYYCNECNCNFLFTYFCLIRFPFLRTCIPFTSRRFYALPIAHDNSRKYAQVPPATTSFPWRHANTCKNHGYNTVADDFGQVSSATTSFPWHHTNTCKNRGYNAVAGDYGQLSSAKTSFPCRYTNTRKNHGYNAVVEVSCASSHVVPRILHSLPTKKVKKVEKGQTFSDHIYPTVSSRWRRRCVQSLVQIGSEMWIRIRYKQTNKHSSLYIRWRLPVSVPLQYFGCRQL